MERLPRCDSPTACRVVIAVGLSYYGSRRSVVRRRGSAALYRLLIVRRPSGTLQNPVGVTDNKQAVSTPANNTDDIPIETL